MSFYPNHEAYLRAVIPRSRYNAEHARYASFREQSRTILNRQEKELHKIIVDREIDAILEEETVS